MFALLNPRLLIALAIVAALAFSHFQAYRKGKHAVRQEWLAATAAANSEARTLERARQSRADDAARLAASRQGRILVDSAGARDAVGGVRDDIGAVRLHAEKSIAAANESIRTLGDVLQSCTAEYQRMAEEADRNYNEALTLRQAWPQ